MPDMRHRIPWPNEKGYTPCSGAYARVHAARAAIWSPEDGRSLDELSLQEYESFNRLDMELLSLQASGEHLGKSVRF